MLSRVACVRRNCVRISTMGVIVYGNDKWNGKDVVDQLSTEKIGKQLAEDVASVLASGKELASCHQGYCGWALIHGGENRGQSAFQLVQNDEGYGPNHFFGGHKWKDRASFVDRLAEQSDLSLSGCDTESLTHVPGEEKKSFLNNQAITKKRLSDFVEQNKE